MKTVYLGLGSNLGNRHDMLMSALDALGTHEFIDIQGMSEFHETAPESDVPQPAFLNGVVSITTILTPQELLVVTQTIEKQLGRTEKGTYGPRPIDIDILFYGDDIICDDELTIPHPLLHQRSFVLEPLMEIAPDLIHPLLQQSITELCHEVVGY